MKNVKKLLKQWKYVHEAGTKLLGTNYEVLNEVQLKSLEESIQSLHTAIIQDYLGH